MLDTILTILGILGIILLVLLGTLLVILLIVLFFPISYKAEGMKNEDTFRVAAKVNWLFRLIRVRFAYPDPGNLVVKALWFTLFDSKAEKKDAAVSGMDGSVLTGNVSDSSADTVAESAGDTATGNVTDSVVDTTGNSAAGDAADTGAGSVANVEQEEPDGKETEKKRGIRQKITEKIEKIKYTILNIYGKIKNIWDNIKFYKDLLQEEQTKSLLRHLGLRLKKILLAIRPRKISADIVFGANSPDTTGYCMAVYGILSPILGKRVRFTPDFEQAVFRGEFSLAGHITLFTVLLHACIFAFDKKLRLLIAKIKKFHKKEDAGQPTA